jgi:DNA-binding NarL/FixJ family response regulator
VHEGEWWVERSLLAQAMQQLIQQGETNNSTTSDFLALTSPLSSLAAFPLATGNKSAISDTGVLHSSVMQQITPREKDIILLVGRGFTNRRIATQLNLSERTVHSHLASIFQKLDVTNRLELALLAYRWGWLTPLPKP